MGEIDDHDWMEDPDDSYDAGITNCRHCGKRCFWEPKKEGEGYVLLDYKTEKPHHCHRGLTPQRIVSQFDDIS